MRRILDLARRTGDRVIVTDPEGKEAFVLLSLDAYEALLVKTVSKQAPAKPPVSIPTERVSEPVRRPQPRSRPEEEDGGPPPDIFDLMAGPGDETWDLAHMSSEELGQAEVAFRAAEQRRHTLRRALGNEQSAVQSQKTTRQPVPRPVVDDTFGEEQFYLEPIE